MAETETAAPSLDDETTAALTLFNTYVDADRERTRHEKRVKKAERAKDEAAAAVRKAGERGTPEEKAAAEAAYREAQEAFKKIRDGEEPEEAPAEQAPAEEATAEEASAETPADETPAEEATAEETPAEAATEEAPVEDAPAEEAPAAEDVPAMETDRTDDDAEDVAEGDAPAADEEQ